MIMRNRLAQVLLLLFTIISVIGYVYIMSTLRTTLTNSHLVMVDSMRTYKLDKAVPTSNSYLLHTRSKERPSLYSSTAISWGTQGPFKLLTIPSTESPGGTNATSTIYNTVAGSGSSATTIDSTSRAPKSTYTSTFTSSTALYNMSSAPKSTATTLRNTIAVPDGHDQVSFPGKCHEEDVVKDFVFTKVEKTGSTTMFTIFTRFVRDNLLTVLAPLSAYHINWERTRGKLYGWDIGPEQKDRANVLADHAIYNKSMLDKYMVNGYKHVAIIREPVSWYTSAVQFFSKEPTFRQKNPNFFVQGKLRYTAEDILMNGSAFYLNRFDGSGIKSWFHLGQLQWYGLDYKLRNNMSTINEYIAWLNQKIDVIILTEQFDASLVVLRRKFCWTYTNIFYQRYMVQKRRQTSLTTDAINKLLSEKYNLGDELLYESLNNTWWKQAELKEDNFWDEVSHFTELNKNISTLWCGKVIQRRKSHTIPANQWHPSLQITPDLCNAIRTKKELRHYVVHKTGPKPILTAH